MKLFLLLIFTAIISANACHGEVVKPFVASTGQLVIAEKSRSRYTVVLPDLASPSQRYAAEELVRFIKEMSGAVLPIVTDEAMETPFEIVLGNSRRLHSAGVAVDWARLGDEGFLLQTVGDRLFVAGSGVRGSLYGVYELLEETWGCRWYTSDVSQIPRHQVLMLPAMNAQHVPALEYREPFWTEAFDGNWAARNRLIACDHSHDVAAARLEARHGGLIVYKGFVHTFDQLVPVDLFVQHPEYFSLRAGKRQRDRSQRCLTNPAVLRTTIAAVRSWLKESPDAKIVSVSQNDNSAFCECDQCKKLDEAEGSHAGTLLAFVNSVAQDIEAEYPRVAIDTLAYTYTRTPPRTIRPRPNVIVRLCSIECCFSHPLTECHETANTSFMKDLEGWSQLTHRLFVWDYTTDFSHFLLPFPNLGVLDQNLRTFVTHGVTGVFEQGNASKGGGGELAELRAWLLAQLLWDPTRDCDSLIREFIDGVYGAAAAPVKRFLNRQREAIASSGEHVHIYDGADRRYLDRSVLDDCDVDLNEAERAAKSSGDSKVLSRVTRLRMAIWYTRIAQGAESLERVIKPATRQLLQAARILNMTQFHEGVDVDLDYSRMNLILKRKPVTPNTPGTLVGEDSQFTLRQEGILTTLIEDPAAEDHAAARQAGRPFLWSIQWKLPDPLAVRSADRSYRLRIRVRTEQYGTPGSVFHTHLYDATQQRAILECTVTADEVQDRNYHWYDIGIVNLNPDLYVWVSPDKNEKVVQAIYVDRFELVPIAASSE